MVIIMGYRIKVKFILCFGPEVTICKELIQTKWGLYLWGYGNIGVYAYDLFQTEVRVVDVFLAQCRGDVVFICWSDYTMVATTARTKFALFTEELVAGETLFFSVYVWHVVCSKIRYLHSALFSGHTIFTQPKQQSRPYSII